MKRSDVSDVLILRLVHERWMIIRTQGPAIDERGLLVYPPTPVQILGEQFPPKVVRAKMEQLEKRRLIECSSSAESGWLTARGEEALAEAETSMP